MTEEPDDLIGHIRICGGAGWVTTGSTRKWTLTAFAPLSGTTLYGTGGDDDIAESR